jgi:hypothetical protein
MYCDSRASRRSSARNSVELLPEWHKQVRIGTPESLTIQVSSLFAEKRRMPEAALTLP